MATQQSTWWARNKEQSLEERIRAIQKINDPTTNADEILTASKWIIVLLLAFTGLLGALSYYKNFSGAFPPAAAIAMAFALTVTIEYGKNYFATWAIRIPFFRGFPHITERPHNTFIFLGLVAFAAVTFYMSVFNSTVGGHQLSRILSHERNQQPFAANTQGIDAQIATLSKGIDETRKIQWKGTTTRKAQEAIASSTKSIEALQRQREMAIAQQRADWERNQATLSENSNFTARLVMLSGGWVEALQLLLMLLRVSCEKALDSRQSGQHQAQGRIGFQRSFQPATNNNSSALPSDQEVRRPIGFFSNRQREQAEEQVAEQPRKDTVPPPVPAAENAVEQRSTKEQPSEQRSVPASEQARSTAVLADVKYWEKRANQCFHRSMTQANEAHREHNRQRCTCFCRMLEAVGVSVYRDDATLRLEFTHPSVYNTSQEAIAKIEKYLAELETIGKK